MDLFGNEVIRTLGLHQPYASLMWTHNKIETRWVKKGKKPPFPLGKYMIYSTKKVYKLEEVNEISGPWLDRFWLNDLRYALTGMPLLIADLYDVQHWESQAKIKGTYSIPETFVNHVFSDTHKLVLLKFTNLKRIKNFPFKGKQGVGILTPEQKAMIEFL